MLFQHRVRNADIGDLDRPAMQPAGPQDMSGLPTKERDGVTAFTASPITAPLVPLCPCQIDGDHRHASGVVPAILARAALAPGGRDRRRQRVDDEARAPDGGRRGRLDRPLPALRGRRRIALRLLRSPSSDSRTG